MSEEKRYYIDPGIGKKKHNCPYSCYEDGRDVKEDILPPKGYVLKGFKHIPQSSDKRYDGKLIAEYEKAPFATRLKQNLAMYALFALVIVVALIVLSILGVFSKSTKHETPQPTPIEVTKLDTVVKQDSVLTDTVNETIPVTKDTKQTVAETTPTQTITPAQPSTPSDKTPAAKTEPEAVKTEPIVDKTETPVAKPEAPVTKPETPVAKTETPAAKTETPVAKTETPTKPIESSIQTEGTTATNATAQFNQEFWKLIHNQERNMSTYHALYGKYKNSNLKNKEFFYLYLTILENTAGFNAWKAKLVQVPANEIKSINTISALTEKLNEYK